MARGEAPTARSSAIVSSRRCTSARAEATTITPAPTRAPSETATSSAITIPAAPSISTPTPSRVMKLTPDRP